MSAVGGVDAVLRVGAKHGDPNRALSVSAVGGVSGCQCRRSSVMAVMAQSTGTPMGPNGAQPSVVLGVVVSRFLSVVGTSYSGTSLGPLWGTGHHPYVHAWYT